MKLADMELPKKTKKDLDMESKPVPYEGPRYPYGLELRFENESISKLSQLKGAKVGDKIMVEGLGEVSNVSMHEDKDGKEKWSVSVQLQEIGCETKKKSRETMAEAMSRRQKDATL